MSEFWALGKVEFGVNGLVLVIKSRALVLDLLTLTVLSAWYLTITIMFFTYIKIILVIYPLANIVNVS